MSGGTATGSLSLTSSRTASFCSIGLLSFLIHILGSRGSDMHPMMRQSASMDSRRIPLLQKRKRRRKHIAAGASFANTIGKSAPLRLFLNGEVDVLISRDRATVHHLLD